MQRTLIDLFKQSVKKYANNPMMWEKGDGEYRSTSYRAAFEITMEVAAGLMSLGLGKGDRVVLLSEGCNDWVYSELGILFAGGINVPLSVKLQESSEVRFRLSHSGARFAMVSGRQLPKILDIKNNLPDLEKIIVFNSPLSEDPDLMAMKRLREEGRKLLKKNQSLLDKRIKDIKEDDAANICYTSGTTADPKGIVLTHRNYTANIEQSRAFYTVPEHYISLLILPWDHAFAHTCGVYTLIASGASFASIEIGKTAFETTKNIGKNIREIKPHFLLSVPALSDSFKRNIERGISEKGKAVERLFRQGLTVAQAYQGNGVRNGKWQGCNLLKPLYKFYDKLIFSKVREQFGGRLEFFVGGGALLDIGYQRFFAALGIPVYQGYGLTEASPVISANHPKDQKMGSSGPIVPKLNIKICDENGQALTDGSPGEIVVQGQNVMKEYWQNPEATTKALKDGWLYTGDMGYVDGDGFLMVLGRYKSLLISDDGEKFSPEGIEENLTVHSPFIRQIMLYNNQSPYTTSLIVPDKAQIMKALKKAGLTHTSEEGKQEVIRMIQADIDKIKNDPVFKKQFPAKWLPASFALLGEEFTEANRFLNSTLKMVRWRIAQNYQDRIDTMYTPEGKNPLNARNMMIVQRMDSA